MKAIAAGWGFSLALKTDGTAWAWGNLRAWRNVDPATIIGSAPRELVEDRRLASGSGFLPCRVRDWSDVVAIDAECRGLVLRKDGSVWEWGYDCPLRQVGKGDFQSALPPAGLHKVLAISTGWNRSMALLAPDETAAIRGRAVAVDDGKPLAWASVSVNAPGRLADTLTDRDGKRLVRPAARRKFGIG